MGNRYFSAKVNHVSNLPELHHGDNKQMMYVLDTVNEAISQNVKISFIYNEYSTDFKLHPKRAEKYIVNPYQMVANNGFYYLIGNYDKYDNVSHYRLDKMTCVEMLAERAKPKKRVKGLEHGLDLPKHMAEHIYMFGGESVSVELLADEKMMDDLIDWFGKDFRIVCEKEDGQLLIRLECNKQAFFYWALQYGCHVEVLKPEDLRNDIAEMVGKIYEKYFI